MSIETDSGSIIPSGHPIALNGQPSIKKIALSEATLRVGRIIKIYNPTDQANLSKKWIEYDILVDRANSMGIHTQIVYPHCVIANLFGGAADYIEYTLRQESLNSPSNNKTYLGSWVLLLCMDSNANQSLIIGGIKHPKAPTQNPDDGHHYTFSFNGTLLKIANDGSVSLTIQGPTKSDGTVSSKISSSFSFNADGSIKLNSGSANTGEVDITATSHVNIKSSGVNTGAATDATILGTTYRTAEGSTNNLLATNMTTLSTEMATASGLCDSISALHIIPIVGPILASPLVASLGVSLATMSTGFATMSSAISSFESNASNYRQQS
ncbi:MAG: hypothetical protein KGO96_07730 [Elusimicrobia bacterium]|nr:hypothetical protein [Elusimicrobiota bacterium]